MAGRLHRPKPHDSGGESAAAHDAQRRGHGFGASIAADQQDLCQRVALAGEGMESGKNCERKLNTSLQMVVLAFAVLILKRL